MPNLKSETLKKRMGLSGPALNRIPGPAPLIPDHEMIRCIGQGSYGEVWLARNAVGTWRAVKVVYRQNFDDPRPYEREFAGIQSYEPISRSNEGLIDILQIGRNDAEGYFYYVMELADPADPEQDEQGAGVKSEEVEGPKQTVRFDPDQYVPKTLSRVIQQRSRLTYEECITLGLTLNLALGHLHRHGLIHRDVKPSNIIFINGVPKLTDIGLVTDLAGAMSFVGTEGYIPPEGPNSPQADLFALGKVLYEASMGKDRNEFPEPFTALGLDDESKALMELNAVLVRACAPNPKERYKRAEEMNADLARLHNGESVRDKHALERRVRQMTRAGLVTVAVVVLAVIPYSLALREARRATDSARSQEQQRKLAEKEALKSKEVAQFLTDMLNGVQPSFAQGRDTTMLREILEQTADRIGRDLQEQPEVEAELRSTLGEVYKELGEYKAAEVMLRRALELRSRSPGPESLAAAQLLSQLSPALCNQGKAVEAEKIERQALAIRTRLLNSNDLAIAESLLNLGYILSAEARLSEAEKMFRQALEIRTRALGPENLLVAQCLTGLGNMLNGQGQWAASEKIFREALAINLKLAGPQHPSSASALNDLVLSLLTQGKVEEAERDAREGLAIQKKVFAADHPVIAASLTRLARVLDREDKKPEAKTALEEAMTIWHKRVNNQDPNIGETVSALLDTLFSEGDYAETKTIYQEVLLPAAQSAVPNKSLLYACGNYLARTGQWKAAAEKFVRLIELEPGNHHNYQALAALYIQMQDFDSYRELCGHILTMFGSVINDPRIADRMAKSCLALPLDGPMLSGAARLADIAVTFDTNSAAVPWFQFCKGFAEYRQGNFNAAIDWMRKVLSRQDEGSIRDVEAYMVLAMAEHGLQQQDSASKTLSDGEKLADKRLRKISSGDLETGWTDWILAHSLMREAKGLISNRPGHPPDTTRADNGNPQ